MCNRMNIVLTENYAIDEYLKNNYMEKHEVVN